MRIPCFKKKFPLRGIFSALALVLVWALETVALENPGKDLDAAGIEMNRGGAIDLSLTFMDASGAPVELGSLVLKSKPLIILPVYYDCPRLCGLLLSGAISVLNDINLSIGSDYSVVAVSFDTSEGPDDAAATAAKFTPLLDTRHDPEAWSFLVGTKESVSRLMQQIGFRYIPDQGEFAHAAALVVVTPDGKIAQYFTGISFPPRDVRLALVEAAQGKIGSIVDQVLLFCFRFDPTKGKYTWAAWNFARFGSILCVGLFVLVVARAVRRT